MDAIDDIAFFRAVADAGSLGAGARALGSSPPAASRRLAAIERRLGVRLVERSARRFRLTDEGRMYYQRGSEILSALRDVEAEITSRGSVARGLLRIAAPSDLGRHRIAPALAQFAKRHPGLSLQLLLSDIGAEVAEDELDVAIRTGMPSDPNTVVRKLASAPRKLCAAPGYLETHGHPWTLDALPNHQCLALARRHRRPDRWQYHDTSGTLQSLAIPATLSSTDGEVIRQWALAGVGLSLEAAWDVDSDLAAGRLVECLPDVAWCDVTLFAAFLPGNPISPRVRLVVDWLAQAFA